MNVTVNRLSCRNNRPNPRLFRLGILNEPLGYAEGQNLYEYVDGAPTSAIDPTGLAAEGPSTTPADTYDAATSSLFLSTFSHNVIDEELKPAWDKP